MDDLYRLYDYRGTRPSQMLLVDNIFDPVTGEVRLARRDFKIPGPIPLTLLSTWQSQPLFSGQIGSGWVDNWNIFVLPKLEHMHLHLPTGEIAAFETPWSGGQSSHPVVLDWKLEFLNDRPTFQVPGGFFYEFGLHDGKRLYLRRIYNRAGDEVRFKRSAYGDLKQVLRSDGVSVKVECEDINFDRILGPDPRTGDETELASYRYNEKGQLIYSRGVLSGEWAYVYDENGLLTHRVRPNEACEAFRFDAQKRLLARRFTHGMMALDCAYPKEDMTVIRRGGEVITTFELDVKARAVRAFEFADKTRVQLDRDDLGRVTLAYLDDTVASGPVETEEAEPSDVQQPDMVHYAYDEVWGQLSSVTGGSSPLLEFSFSEDGSLTRVECLGLNWLLYYSETGQLTFVDTPEGTKEKLNPANGTWNPTSWDVAQTATQSASGAEHLLEALRFYLERPAGQHPHWIGGAISGAAEISGTLNWAHALLQAPAESTQIPASLIGSTPSVALGLPTDVYRAISNLTQSALFGSCIAEFNPQDGFRSTFRHFPLERPPFPESCVDGPFAEDQNGRDKLGRLISDADQSIRLRFLSNGVLSSLENSKGAEIAVVSDGMVDVSGLAHLQVSEADGAEYLRVWPWNANPARDDSKVEQRITRNLTGAVVQGQRDGQIALERSFNGRLPIEQTSYTADKVPQRLILQNSRRQVEHASGYWCLSDSEVRLDDKVLAQFEERENALRIEDHLGQQICLERDANGKLLRLVSEGAAQFEATWNRKSATVRDKSGYDTLKVVDQYIEWIGEHPLGELRIAGNTTGFSVSLGDRKFDCERHAETVELHCGGSTLEICADMGPQNLPKAQTFRLNGEAVFRLECQWGLGKELVSQKLFPVVAGFFQNTRSRKLPVQTTCSYSFEGLLEHIRLQDNDGVERRTELIWSPQRQPVFVFEERLGKTKGAALLNLPFGQIQVGEHGILFQHDQKGEALGLEVTSRRDLGLSLADQHLRFLPLFNLLAGVPILEDLFPFSAFLPERPMRRPVLSLM